MIHQLDLALRKRMSATMAAAAAAATDAAGLDDEATATANAAVAKQRAEWGQVSVWLLGECGCPGCSAPTPLPHGIGGAVVGTECGATAHRGQSTFAGCRAVEGGGGGGVERGGERGGGGGSGRQVRRSS